MLLEPLISLHPKISLSCINGLFFPRVFTGGQFGPRTPDGTEEPAPNKEVEERKDDSNYNQRENTFPLVHSFVPTRYCHFGRPSNRNCAWLLGRIRGSAMVNWKTL